MKKIFGFTLIEVMITVAIIAILATIAYPSYLDYVRHSRRSDAISSLLSAQLRQEEFRLTNRRYADDSEKTQIGLTDSTFYLFSVSAAGSAATSTYTMTATATGGQVGDSENGVACNLTITNRNVKGPNEDCWK